MRSIGRLAQETGVKVATIRYYERVGLLPAPERSAGNQRLYGDAAMRRLAFIRHARELGFPLDAVRDLLHLADDPERPCDEVDAIAREQLAQVRRRITRLEALAGELTRMLAQCEGERVADCRVIEVLGDHALCADAHDRGGEPPTARS
jgi:DNA-binding transcriptional MerR regulator